MKRIKLSMYLKCNLGDDLFLDIISRRYPNVSLYSTAKRSNRKRFAYKNVRWSSLIARAYRKIFKKNKDGLKKYDAHVLLGGSMFIDKKISKDELRERNKNLKTSIPLYILGANFGPYYSDYFLSEHKKIFSKAKDVCFREHYSADLFNDLENVRVAPDIVFGLDKKRFEIKNDKKVIISAINLESREKLSQYQDQYENRIAEIAQKYTDGGYEVVLMSFCKAEGDQLAIDRIYDATKDNKKITKYCYDGDIDKALNEIASSEIVIGTRFHSVVLGLVFEKKVLPIIYSNKTKNMLKDINYKGKLIEISEMDNLSADEVMKYPYSYGSVDKLAKESEKHFEKLDKFLKENN